MKKLFLILAIVTSSFTATHYEPSAFVAANTLYCTDYYGKQIVEYKKGDIISSDQAYTYCSYNLSTVENIKKNMASIHNEQKDIENRSFPMFIAKAAVIIITFLSLVVWILDLIEAKRKKLEKTR